MSVNSSGSDSHLQPFTMNISFPLKPNCFISKPSSTISNAFNIINILLILPLCILILHYCLQEWRQKRSTSSAATMSHSDLFTYHMVIIELIDVLGCILRFCGSYRYYTDSLFSVGTLLSSFTWTAQMFFHILTCLERYLAIVHPITYLSLRNDRGIKMRNISIGCVWLLSFVEMYLVMIKNIFYVDFCISAFSLAIISFCSISVLCVLIRPGPGDQGRNRERVDPSKLRAFYTIVAILGVLMLRVVWGHIWGVMYLYLSGQQDFCIVMSFSWCFNLPSSLILPVLLLQRKGKLMCCKNRNQ